MIAIPFNDFTVVLALTVLIVSWLAVLTWYCKQIAKDMVKMAVAKGLFKKRE